MQRCALAIALALNPDILLLDGKEYTRRNTSALYTH